MPRIGVFPRRLNASPGTKRQSGKPNRLESGPTEPNLVHLNRVTPSSKLNTGGYNSLNYRERGFTPLSLSLSLSLSLLAPKKTSDRPPASDPNPSTTPPSTSVATGGTATASLLPSLALALTTNQPPPLAPPLSIQEILQEHISGTSVETTTSADFAGPSTSPSALATSTSSPPRIFQPIPIEFMSFFLPKFVSITLAMKQLRDMVPDVTGWQRRPMDPALRTFLAVAEEEMKAVSDFVADMKELKGALEEFVTQLKEMKRVIGSGGSYREGGGPDSGSGGGDDQ